MLFSLVFAKILFVVFFLVSCAFCELAHADDDADNGGAVNKTNIFKLGDTRKITALQSCKEETLTNVKSFSFPVLLATGDVMVVIVGGNQDGGSQTTDILTRHIETKDGSDWLQKAFVEKAEIAENWNTQCALHSKQEKHNVKSLAAAATNSKIYVFLVNESAQLPQTDGEKWECVFIEGKINSKEETAAKKEITWTISKKLDLSKSEHFQSKKAKDYLQILSAFVTSDDKKVLFVVKGETDQEKKKVFAITEKTGSNTDFEVVTLDDLNKNCNLNFFLLGDKIIMIPNSCNGNEKIQEFDIATRKLGECNKCAKRVWGFLKDKNAVTTVTINNTLVLFTKQQIIGNKKDIYLWITDGNRLPLA